MSTFSLGYPSAGPYTATWTPSKNPSVDQSQIADDPGFISDLMADGMTIYTYKIVPTFARYTFSFSGLTTTDRTNLLTFIDTVGGFAFDLTSGACGPLTSAKKVKFGAQSPIEWQLQPGRLGMTLEFIDSA